MKPLGVVKRGGVRLTLNARKVLSRRYLAKDEQGRTIETASEMFGRVARDIALADELYPGGNVAESEETFYRLMTTLRFLPNSPTLMNAGTPISQLSACFVLPIEDSIDGIFGAAKSMALIHKSGGGTGFSFSHLRPKGDVVQTTRGVASGPVSFMRVFDVATDVVKQGGRRRGANIGILAVDHPDILEFISAKDGPGKLENFNVSVGVSDEFMKAAESGGSYELVNPRTGETVRSMNARDVFELICTMAWRTGDPGIIFLDRINEANPTPAVGRIESTNPCGEQPLLPFESCNLGSINLVRFVRDGQIDWDALRRVVREAVHFLDNVIDRNKFPVPQLEERTTANRKVGLGVMGWADTLIILGIPYDSRRALALAGDVMKFIAEEAQAKSVELGQARGSFPNFNASVWRKRGLPAMRNATTTTIAPTGSISIIAGVSSGIEPLFAVAFVRNVMEGTRLMEVNPLFEKAARDEGLYSRPLMARIAEKGSIQDFKELPGRMRKVFTTALDVPPRWHVRMQAAFQEYVDNGVAKTVNLSSEATIQDVRDVFRLAYRLGSKGITVYRYGSRPRQVLYLPQAAPSVLEETAVRAESEFSGGCPAAECPF